MSEPERYEVEFTESVARDLDLVVAYLIEQGAVAAAGDLIVKFREKVASLEQFPRRGNVPREAEGMPTGELRQLVMTPYRLFYRIYGSRVVIVLLADGRRDMRSLLRQRLLIGVRGKDD